MRAAQQLAADGFCTLPGPYRSDELPGLASSYSRAMADGLRGADGKASPTNSRVADLLNHTSAFDRLLTFAPLLQLSRDFIHAPIQVSSLLGRTVHAQSPAQQLHADLPRSSPDAPLLGWIFRVDPFTPHNGATRFVPGSHRWPALPDPSAAHPAEVRSCGPAGELLVFDASCWHGYSANTTELPRRSVQGYFVRRDARQGFSFAEHLFPATQARLSAQARSLLALPDRGPTHALARHPALL
jgi:ectoine hydroxylase-related dioxygenase (phytanoyl-CoA dioxygenase family)